MNIPVKVNISGVGNLKSQFSESYFQAISGQVLDNIERIKLEV